MLEPAYRFCLMRREASTTSPPPWSRAKNARWEREYSTYLQTSDWDEIEEVSLLPNL